jgi:hypothetical protein
MMRVMGEVVSLQDYRDREVPQVTAMRRLESAVGRLDLVVQRRPGRMAPTVERELLIIVRAFSSGMTKEAPDRAERLADLLEHPAASGS